MGAAPIALGIDIGTSGVRACALDAGGAQTAMASAPAGGRDAALWLRALEECLHRLRAEADLSGIAALCVDGTSGTLLPVGGGGEALAPALMYNDSAPPECVARVAAHAPNDSAALGPTSGLAKFLALQDVPGVARLLHQADWIAGQFCGRFDFSDENNALKTGYDPVARRWPDWIAAAGARMALLPRVFPPGAIVAPVTPAAAERFGLPPGAAVCAGTTDGCASFFATGAEKPGEAATALGSTLVVKLMTAQPIFAPRYGLYSHRFGDVWLAGGASNSGGAVLAHFFTPERMDELSARIDPSRDSGLDYYPLLRPGERFPISDPDLPPRLTPRPADDALFLHGLFEGMARIERLAFERLAELGAPWPKNVRSVGGGARNKTFSAIRARILGIPMPPALSEEAAFGAARLAWAAARAS